MTPTRRLRTLPKAMTLGWYGMKRLIGHEEAYLTCSKSKRDTVRKMTESRLFADSLRSLQQRHLLGLSPTYVHSFSYPGIIPMRRVTRGNTKYAAVSYSKTSENSRTWLRSLKLLQISLKCKCWKPAPHRQEPSHSIEWGGATARKYVLKLAVYISH